MSFAFVLWLSLPWKGALISAHIACLICHGAGLMLLSRSNRSVPADLLCDILVQPTLVESDALFCVLWQVRPTIWQALIARWTHKAL